MKIPAHFESAFSIFGLMHDLPEMRRTDFFFAFRDKTRFTGIFFPAALIACNAARNVASGPF